VTFFASKSINFFCPAMKARILTAALHFNENSNRPQATCKKGDACWGVSFPKSRQGEPVLKAVNKPSTYSYVGELLEEVFVIRTQYPSYDKAAVPQNILSVSMPQPVAAAYSKCDKKKLVLDHKKRFNK